MITATNPETAIGLADDAKCTGCRSKKKAPLAAVVDIGEGKNAKRILLCQECGRDIANAIGFMCIRDGMWSKLEPKRRKRGVR